MPAVQVSENSPVLFPEPGLSFRGWQVSELPPVLRDLRLSVSSHFWPGMNAHFDICLLLPVQSFVQMTVCCSSFFKIRSDLSACGRKLKHPTGHDVSCCLATWHDVACCFEFELPMTQSMWIFAWYQDRSECQHVALWQHSVHFSGYQSVRHTRLIQLLHVDSTSVRSVSHSNQTF